MNREETYSFRMLNGKVWTFTISPTTLIRDVKTMCKEHLQTNDDVSLVAKPPVTTVLEDDKEIGTYNICDKIIVRVKKSTASQSPSASPPVPVQAPIASPPAPVQKAPDEVSVKPHSVKDYQFNATPDDFKIAYSVITNEEKTAAMLEIMAKEDPVMEKMVRAHLECLKISLAAKIGV